MRHKLRLFLWKKNLITFFGKNAVKCEVNQRIDRSSKILTVANVFQNKGSQSRHNQLVQRPQRIDRLTPEISLGDETKLRFQH